MIFQITGDPDTAQNRVAPALAATALIVAVTPLIRIDQIVGIVRLSRPQATITLTAFVLTLVLAPNIEWAIIAAIAFSVVIHLWRELQLDVIASSREERLELAPQGGLWFGSAQLLENRFLDLLAEQTDAKELHLRLDGLGRIDLTGALALKSIIDHAHGAGLVVSVRGAPKHSSRVLQRVLGNDMSHWAPRQSSDESA